MATKVTTLKNAEKTDNLLPRTELNAIFDSDGNYLDSNLKASDLNALKGGAIDELVRFTEDGAGTPIPTDADTLEGHGASYFATADAVTSLIPYSRVVSVSFNGGTATPFEIGTTISNDTHTVVAMRNATGAGSLLITSSISNNKVCLYCHDTSDHTAFTGTLNISVLVVKHL